MGGRERELVVGAEYYQRGREAEETDTLELAFNNQEDTLLVPVSTQEKHMVTELLVHGEVNAKQHIVKNLKHCEDQKHGDEEYLEEVITRVVESQKRMRSVPKSSEKYYGGKHNCPSSSHLPYVKASLEPEHNIEDCLVPSCREQCDVVEEEKQVWQRQRMGQLEKQNVKFQAKLPLVKRSRVMLHQLDDTMINSYLGGTCQPTRKIFQNQSLNTRISLPSNSVADQFQETAFTGRHKLQVAVKQPADLGDMEEEGTVTAYSYIPQITGEVVRSPSKSEDPDCDGRSNRVNSEVEKSHVCPRRKDDFLLKTKQINHSHSSFAASAVKY